jgi:hypothetical protein
MGRLGHVVNMGRTIGDSTTALDVPLPARAALDELNPGFGLDGGEARGGT